MNYHEGIIIDDYLNVRITGPNRNHPPLDTVLERGDTVLIERAVIGEEIDGENTWYVLDTGHFIWSGYVATDTLITPEIYKKKIIFTADDYGVVESINKGVIQAVIDGRLNSVTCLTNYGPSGEKSLENIRDLIAKTKPALERDHKKLELGVHLTITSGSPLIGRNNARTLCRPENKLDKDFEYSDFFDYTDLTKYYEDNIEKTDKKARFLRELKQELREQLRVFTHPVDKGDPIKIAHITSHHNSLLFKPEFFKVMCELAVEFGSTIGGVNKPVPVRSLNNLPGWKDRGYLCLKGDVKFPKRLIESLKSILKENKAIKSPDMLHSNHYGPLPIQNKKFTFNALVNKKIDRAKGMINDLIKGPESSMEFLLHLREGDLKVFERNYKKKETQPTGYAGINHKAFDSRKAEFDAFIEKFGMDKELDKELEMGSWKDILES